MFNKNINFTNIYLRGVACDFAEFLAQLVESGLCEDRGINTYTSHDYGEEKYEWKHPPRAMETVTFKITNVCYD